MDRETQLLLINIGYLMKRSENFVETILENYQLCESDENEAQDLLFRLKNYKEVKELAQEEK